jgi:hypothetical protein
MMDLIYYTTKWQVVPYIIAGVKLFAVEDFGGYIMKYCNTAEDAQKFIDDETWA